MSFEDENEIDIFEKGAEDAVFVETGTGGYLYVLVAEQICDDGSDGKRSAYSILAVLFADGELTDREFVYDVTSEYETAQKIFHAVSDGKASPITIGDIIEDLVADVEVLS